MRVCLLLAAANACVALVVVLLPVFLLDFTEAAAVMRTPFAVLAVGTTVLAIGFLSILDCRAQMGGEPSTGRTLRMGSASGAAAAVLLFVWSASSFPMAGSAGITRYDLVVGVAALLSGTALVVLFAGAALGAILGAGIATLNRILLMRLAHS